MLPDKAQILLVCCRSGVRSARAAHILIELGYIHVYDIGGIIDWLFETTVFVELMQFITMAGSAD